jgi:hypothetical protein
MKYYFDTNVFHHIARRREVAGLARLLRGRGDRLLLSSAHYAEIIRISEFGVRAARVAAVFAFEVQFLPPEPLRRTDEFMNELARFHPDWLIPGGGARYAQSYAIRYRDIWRDLRDHPDVRPARIQDFDATEAQSAGTHRDRQRNTRDRLNARDGHVRDRLPLSSVDEHWRLVASKSWDEDIFEPSKLDSSLLIRNRLDETRVTRMALASFWIKEATVTGVPRHQASGAVDFVQRRHSLSPGNMLDTDHAANLLDADRFVTADQDFADALEDLNGIFDTASKLIRLDPDQPVAGQLLGEFRRHRS